LCKWIRSRRGLSERVGGRGGLCEWVRSRRSLPEGIGGRCCSLSKRVRGRCLPEGIRSRRSLPEGVCGRGAERICRRAERVGSLSKWVRGSGPKWIGVPGGVAWAPAAFMSEAALRAMAAGAGVADLVVAARALAAAATAPAVGGIVVRELARRTPRARSLLPIPELARLAALVAPPSAHPGRSVSGTAARIIPLEIRIAKTKQAKSGCGGLSMVRFGLQVLEVLSLP